METRTPMQIQPEPCKSCGRDRMWYLDGLGGVSSTCQCGGYQGPLQRPTGRNFICPYLSHQNVPEGCDFNYRYNIEKIAIEKGPSGVWYWVLTYGG